jgi:hypothetical protein
MRQVRQSIEDTFSTGASDDEQTQSLHTKSPALGRQGTGRTIPELLSALSANRKYPSSLDRHPCDGAGSYSFAENPVVALAKSTSNCETSTRPYWDCRRVSAEAIFLKWSGLDYKRE